MLFGLLNRLIIFPRSDLHPLVIFQPLNAGLIFICEVQIGEANRKWFA